MPSVGEQKNGQLPFSEADAVTPLIQWALKD